MEEPTNEIIKKYYNQLVNKTVNIIPFIDQLEAHQVVDAVTKSRLLANKVYIVEDTFNHLMFRTTTNITPVICECLEKSGHAELKDMLSLDISRLVSNQNGDVTGDIVEFPRRPNKPFRQNNRSSDVDEVDSTPITAGQVKMGVQRLDFTPPRPYGAYKMGSRPKGYALIINVELFPNDPKLNRTGSKLDLQKLTRLFSQLGYEVESHENLKAQEISKVAEKFAKDEKHRMVDSCVVFIMTHGISDEDNHKYGKKYMNIQGSDLDYINSLEIINHFVYPSSNVFGQNKPIMFFFQSCRGHSKDFGQPPKTGTIVAQEYRASTTDGIIMNTNDNDTNAEPVNRGRRYDHMLIVHACIPGNVSLRYPDTGAWFVEHLVDVFDQHAWEYDIEAMLAVVDEKIRKIVCEDNGMQTTVVEKWGFTKKLYFNPGLYDDEGLGIEEATNQIVEDFVENGRVCAARKQLEQVAIAVDSEDISHAQSSPPL